MIRNLTLTTFLVSTLGVARAQVEVGPGLDLAKDLPDGGLSTGASQMGVAVVLRSPARLWLTPVIALRGDALVSLGGGQDRVEWRQFNDAVTFYSEDHWTLLSQVGLAAGPELSPWAGSEFAPYAGTTMGWIWARHWHSFDGATAVLLDPEQNDVDSGSNIDPYSDQLAPTVGVHGGVRFNDLLPFAIEVELGYTLAFLREAGLKKAPSSLQAIRTAYGLNPVRLGVNAVFPLGKGSDS